MDIKECYRIFELPIGASRDAVDAAYCRLLERWHPDRVTPAGDPAAIREATRMVQVINEAYQTLIKVAPPVGPGNPEAPGEPKANPGLPATGPASAGPAPSPGRNKPFLNPATAPIPTRIAAAPPPPASRLPPPVPGATQPPMPWLSPRPGVPATSPQAAGPGAPPFSPAPSLPAPLPGNPAGPGNPAINAPPQAGPAAGPNLLARAKAMYDKLFPVDSPQRKYGPLIVAASFLLVLLLAKCAVSSAGEKISAASQARVEANRVRTTGVLVVKSNRPEAAVEATRLASAGEAVAASVKGSLNQSLTALPPGRYAVTLHAAGWPDAQGEVDVPPGQTTEVTVNFKGGSLRLESDPAGAVVKLAGETLGKTPLLIPLLPPGESRLSLEYPFWPALSYTATVTENVESTATVRLPQGKLTVESTPPDATVTLAGRVVGRTPLTLERVPAGILKLTLQAKNFPPALVTVTVEDRGEVKVSPELGSVFPELDPAAVLTAVWVPDDPNRIAPAFDSVGTFAPRNGVVKNLNRKRIYENWLRKQYRYSAVVKSYDRNSGRVEFVDQPGDLAKFRVVALLSLAARNDKALAAPLPKGAPITLQVHGTLSAVEEPRWPFRVITFELSSAELLH